MGACLLHFEELLHGWAIIRARALNRENMVHYAMDGLNLRVEPEPVISCKLIPEQVLEFSLFL